MSSNLFSNSYNDFSYWFSNTTIDNNGEVVSDINAGLVKLIPGMIDELNNTNNEHTKFILPEVQEYMPDMVAMQLYNNEHLWWYICLTNLLVNPFVEYKHNFMYYAFTKTILANHAIEKETSSKNQSKIGTIIELN